MTTTELKPGFGLHFDQFFEREGLDAVEAAFRDFVIARDPDEGHALLRRLDEAREHAAKRAAEAPLAPSFAPERQVEAELIFALAEPLEDFIADLFGVRDPLDRLRDDLLELEPLVKAKWKFVKRQALLDVTPDELEHFDPAATRDALGERFGFRRNSDFDELAFARSLEALDVYAKRRRNDPPRDPAKAEVIALARLYAAWASGTKEGRRYHATPGRVAEIFEVPRLVEPEHLIYGLEHVRLEAAPDVPALGRNDDRIALDRLDSSRHPFELTDPGPSQAKAVDAVNYCLYCHAKEGDTCSLGIREPGVEPVTFRRSVHDVPLTGCPLEERISEFQWLRHRRRPLAALAVILIENPMVAGTGHRICNDCTRACVFQQQTPVDIPAAETRTLHDILALPWGVEIYGLLTRWNPLNFRQWLPRPRSGYRVLVVGTGPAGYTVAHHLLNAGHDVDAIDGLKIEPLAPGLVGPGFGPVRDIRSLEVPAWRRIPGGFGGVAEYGITARWDKNALTLIRLLLERRRRFRLVGGTRFGSQIGTRSAFDAGFDHIALCVGAGAPRTLWIPNGLAEGVRTASDFLMAVQLTGAARPSSLQNIEIRLPVAVIGGGLTATDTATEALAWYVAQVDKFLERTETMEAAGLRPVWLDGPAEDIATAHEYLDHARTLRRLRAEALESGGRPPIVEQLQAWGGATIYYRRRFIDSPAYRLNPEELQLALGEGIRFVEKRWPRAFTVDAHGAVDGIDLEGPDGEREHARARSILIAAGTSPNITVADEEPDHYRRADRGAGLLTVDVDGAPVSVEAGMPKPASVEVFVHREPDGRLVSALGDLHASYAGNVVRAMASARHGAIVIDEAMRRIPSMAEQAAHGVRAANEALAEGAPLEATEAAAVAVATRLEASGEPARALLDGALATVVAVRELVPRVHEVRVRAPLAALNFAPGGFYRLQNFETGSTIPTMEALALTGAAIDRAAGIVDLIVLDVGATSVISDWLAPGTPVVLMGPVGEPTTIGHREDVVLVGGGLGNAVLFSIGAACRANGCRVLYIAGYRSPADCFLPEAIEAAADEIIWCFENPAVVGPAGMPPPRPGDRIVTGTVVDGLAAWADEGSALLPRKGADYPDAVLNPTAVRPASVNRLIVIGSAPMMAAVAKVHRTWLGPRLAPRHRAIASVNSPMQCMMKGVCGQCVQRIVDSRTGMDRHVFTCGAQDQPLDEVDFDCLIGRLRQNHLQEKVTLQWLEGGFASFKP